LKRSPPSSRPSRPSSSSSGSGPKSSSWSLVDEPLSEPFRLEPAPGLLIAGKYRLERLIRKGGMSSVWEAKNADTGAPVAMKIMSATGNKAAEALARVEREARITTMIPAPNIVAIEGSGADRGLPYLVMELLTGEDLGTRLRRLRMISIAEASGILAQVASGLERAHDAGIIHRDLKPDNIFLSKAGDEEVAKILDFGMAKMIVRGADLNEGSAQDGTLIGTPFAMSPEQAKRSPIDHRSDLWSLGVVLFRALTGVRPFRAKSIGDLLAQISSDPIPAPSSLNPSLPAAIDRYFEKALARDPAERFQSATEMAKAFADVAAKIREEGGDTTSVAGPASSMPLSVDVSSGFYKDAIVLKEASGEPAPEALKNAKNAPEASPPPPANLAAAAPGAPATDRAGRTRVVVGVAIAIAAIVAAGLAALFLSGPS
jgi:serine/threonine-protein kinase